MLLLTRIILHRAVGCSNIIWVISKKQQYCHKYTKQPFISHVNGDGSQTAKL